MEIASPKKKKIIVGKSLLGSAGTRHAQGERDVLVRQTSVEREAAAHEIERLRTGLVGFFPQDIKRRTHLGRAG